MPGSSPTIDRRDPVRRLKSVLLPTFGRPQTAISGSPCEVACSIVTDCWSAISSASRHSASGLSGLVVVMRRRGPPDPLPSRSFAACCCEAERKLRPGLGRVCAASGSPDPVPMTLPRVFFSGSSPVMVRLASNSGDLLETRLASAALAFLAASSLRFFGSTAPMRVAPVVAADFGLLPLCGRVLANRCFLPNRFAAFFAAIVLISQAQRSQSADISLFIIGTYAQLAANRQRFS